jgi:hypothetical protein
MQQPTENSHLPWPWRRLCPCSSWALVGRYCSSNKGTQLELPKCDSLPGYPPDPAGGYRPSLERRVGGAQGSQLGQGRLLEGLAAKPTWHTHHQHLQQQRAHTRYTLWTQTHVWLLLLMMTQPAVLWAQGHHPSAPLLQL